MSPDNKIQSNLESFFQARPSQEGECFIYYQTQLMTNAIKRTSRHLKTVKNAMQQKCKGEIKPNYQFKITVIRYTNSFRVACHWQWQCPGREGFS